MSPALRRRPKNPDGRMSLGDHLREFRNRLTIALLAIVAASVIGWIYYDQIIHYLAEPLRVAAEERARKSGSPATVSLINTDVTGAFTIKLKVAFWAGLIIATPVWIWEIWRFVFPGLKGNERRYGVAFLFSAVPLFLLGCWTATLALPNAVAMFLSFTAPDADNLLPMADFITWVTRFVISFGLAYLLPLAMVALDLMHVVTARLLLKGWRVAVVIIMTFGALMSPTPDPWSMFALGVPLIALYFLAVGVCAILDRRRKKSEPEWLDTPDDVASPL